MCGILGTIPAEANHNLFENALAKLTHRGPDGFGIWHSPDQEVTLGHRRLAILDLSDQGKQPMFYGKYVITFNGEIYNFLEIKDELLSKGYIFHTNSDTEIILAAFQEWREECLQKFNGMWAMAIWNKETKELFLSRDRFGQKPLFYAIQGNKLIFASEMKALFPFLPVVKPAENFQWFLDNIFSYESTDKCLIEGIKRFPAGSYAFYQPSSNQLLPKKFWNTLDQLHDVPETYADQVAQFREIFVDACKIRMRADVPIGTALSGGVDSSATICTMAHISKSGDFQRISKNWQHAFIATFPGSFLDETKYAQKVVDYLSIPSYYLPIDPSKGIDTLENYLYKFEELYTTSPIPMTELYGAINKQGVKVSIDGHGADELLAGYGKDMYLAFLDAGLNIKQINNILNTRKHFIPKTTQITNERVPLFAYLKFMRSRGIFNLVKYYGKSLFGLNKRERPEKGEFGHFNQHLYQLYHNTILPTLLRNYDRYSMASSVEIRMPFMDHRLASFCFSLPWQSKLNKGYTKTILRDAIQDIVPQEVIWRKDKIGFSTPIVDWMKNEWKDFLMDHIHSVRFNNCDLIDQEAIRKKVSKVINDSNVTFTEGENAWRDLMPYFWEKAMIN